MDKEFTEGSEPCDAFKGLNPEPGILIWRIEKFIPVAVPKSEYGRFHSGDSYIVLNTMQPPEGSRHYDVHYWLGNESSQDERGSAAYRVVELCYVLPGGGNAPHHRECEGAESTLFLSYFPGGVEYLEGGVEGGFRNAEEGKKQRHRLLQVKGKRVIRVKEVPMSHESLNAGDVFVLDAQEVIYQWQGKESSRLERAKAVETCIKIRDDQHCSRSRIVVVRQGEEPDEFWKELGGKGPIKTAEEGGSDADTAADVKREVKLYWLCDESGEMQITEIQERPLVREMLKSEDAYILDTGSELYAWVGKGATKAERAAAVSNAEKFLETQGRPQNTPITRVCDGGEPPVFKSCFRNWPEGVLMKKLFGVIADKAAQRPDLKSTNDHIDVGAMHKGPAGASKGNVVRREREKPDVFKMYRIYDHDKVEVTGDAMRVLASQHCYVLLLQWVSSGISIVYFWLGNHSTTEQKGTAALVTIEVSDSVGDGASQVRVVQGKEPEAFYELFNGGLVVTDALEPDWEKPHLLHVRGTNPKNVHAVEVDPVTASLNSNDAFALLSGGKTFLWKGKGASDEEKAVAAHAANILVPKNTVVEVEEGSEPEEFWAPLGGKGEYANDESLYVEYREPRLFHCSDASGSFRVDEIEAFGQEDLEDSDVMILDCHQSVFVWIGSGANVDEKRNAMEIAQKYVHEAPDGRDPDTPIYRIESGHEPLIFTCQFHAWDERLQKVHGDACDKAMAKLQLINDSLAELQRKEYPLEVLQKRPLPEGVVAAKLVDYLSEEDFMKAFKMTREEYNKLKPWKQAQLRQKAKLF